MDGVKTVKGRVMIREWSIRKSRFWQAKIEVTYAKPLMKRREADSFEGGEAFCHIYNYLNSPDLYFLRRGGMTDEDGDKSRDIRADAVIA